MSALRRVNYLDGQLLSAEDFRAEHEYHREKSQRHNRRLHGCGVVRGLTVSLAGGATGAAITVKPGVGIDSAGNELELDAERSVPIGVKSRSFWVVLRYVECPVEPVPSLGTCGDAETVGYARIEEDCEVVLVPDEPPRDRSRAGGVSAMETVEISRGPVRPGMARILLPIVVASLLVACGRGDEPAAAAKPEKVLHVYNWADYVGEATIRDFEAQTGIKVVYDVYDSSEVLETKLLTGRSGYDVVVPSGALTYRLIQAGALQKLDKSKLGNLGNMDPQIMQLVEANDPGNEHGVPYLRGTTGIGYNPDRVEKVLGTRAIDSLAAIFDLATASKLAACGITWLDAPADMFQLAFIYLGLDANSHRPEDLAAAGALLTRVRPYVRYFHSSQYVNDLASGEVCVSVGWSGGIQQARQRGAQAAAPVEVSYVIPEEGAPLWCDMVAIPADAPHPEHAYLFLDYLMEPQVIAGITNTVGQANGNAASLPYVAEAIRNDPTIYPSEEVYRRLTIDRSWSPEQMRAVNRAWTRIKTAR